MLAFIASCENANQLTPEETTKQFLTLMADEDFEGAKKYASKETDKTLEAIGKLKGIFNDLDKEPGENLITKDVNLQEDITYVCAEEGDSANCQCCEKNTDKCTTIQLVKENGQWVVHQSKESELE